MQGTFDCGSLLLLSADTPYDVWQDIVILTKSHKNEDKLKWDIYKLPHHCSYKSLAEDKGKEKTEPVGEAQWLLDQGRRGAVIVSTSDPIPAGDTDQPPHRQAYNTYVDQMKKLGGKIVVTMEYPNTNTPEKLVFDIPPPSAGNSLLRTAPVSVGLGFPDKPIIPRKPAGFARL